LLLEGVALRDIAGRFGVPKSSLGRHRIAHLCAALVLAGERELTRRKERLFESASSVRRSIEGWSHIESLDDWRELGERAEMDYISGKFLLDRLGAERHLDPAETVTLQILRSRIVEELDLRLTAELMLVDLAILAYRNTLQVQRWIGDLSVLVEHHLFAIDGPTAKMNERPRVYGLRAEDDAARIRLELLPASERASRQFIATLKALHDFRRVGGVNVVVGSAGQVNVAQQQVAVGSLAAP
jgi:hypothetical protein